VEEEEVMVLAQLQSLVEEDQPHPPISLAPPTETIIIHVQPDNVSTLYLIFIGILYPKKTFLSLLLRKAQQMVNVTCIKANRW